MKAYIIPHISDFAHKRTPLTLVELPVPEPKENDILIRVSVCGVCHTELDEIEGRTPPPRFPIVPGHQIVGVVVKRGSATTRFKLNDRVGVAWIYSACGTCRFCMHGQENLCDSFRATGRDADGGYAEYLVVPEAFAYLIPGQFTDSEAAPLLCAGAIGYRSLRLANVSNGDAVGLTGFGASAHLVLKMIQHLHPSTEVFVFSRTPQERAFARELGAVWAGDVADESPRRLQAIIDTTPAWRSVTEAMKNLKKGGRLVINAIRKEDRDKDALLGLDYGRDIWLEKEIKSVANITKRDVEEFLALAAKMQIRPEVQEYSFDDANQALLDLKERRIRGAKILRVKI